MDRDLSPFAGENKASNFKTGRESLVTVDLFKRTNGTFYMRVSLRSDVKPNVLSRYEMDMDRYAGEKEFLDSVMVAGGALAEHQYTMYGDRHDPDECARAARELARDILHSQTISQG
jgi:hypothetical protein